MNELRMYVEHLFEGKIVTGELIELKEEIFGNLAARYEDFIAQGMDEDEALRKTEESLDSIDGLLESQDADETGDEAVESALEARGDLEPAAEPEIDADAEAVPSESAEGVNEETRDTTRALNLLEKRRGIVLGVVAVLLVVLLVQLAIGFVKNPAESSQTQEYADTVDESYEKAQDLATAIDAAIEKPDMAALKSCKDMTAGDDRNAELLQQLPLGDYLNSVQSTDATNLHLYYRGVPEGLDNSTLYRGFVYDAFCLFAAIPDLERITIDCAFEESDDAEQWFDFSRGVMEELLDKEQGDSLNSDLFDNGEAWKKCVSKFMSDTLMDWINEQETKG